MTREALIETARRAWHDMDSTGTEDYDVLWGAVVDALLEATPKDELTHRVIRIETRLARLMLHLGVNPVTGTPGAQQQPLKGAGRR